MFQKKQPFTHFQKLFFGLILMFLFLFLSFLLMDFCFPLRTKIEYSTIVMAKDSSILETYLSKDSKWRMKTELYEISPELRKTLIFKEDKYFYWHIGVNFMATGKAFVGNIWYWKKKSGASTITMQVVRMLERRKRTYFNKFIEIFRAFQLDFHYSKEEILQLYFNLIPYGGNVEGVKSAAWLFFQKKPTQLSLSQVVTLTLVPNRPNTWALGKKNKILFEAKNHWLKKMGNQKYFPEQDIEIALKEKLPEKKQKPNVIAPQFCRRMKNLFPEQDLIYTYLDKQKQEKIQQLTSNFAERAKLYNINQAAVLVINNQTHTIEAYIGSADFDNKKDEGQNDGVKAIRSPGSTLKPLIYALAIEKGLITPKTILDDVPTDFGGYIPENFNKKFVGQISVENALKMSLNIPAVKVLQLISPQILIEKLLLLRYKSVKKEEKKLGLSMALGGVGASLEELVNLYQTFANKGNFIPFIYQKKQKINEKRTILKQESTYLVGEILGNMQRDENTKNPLRVAWKTGTSLGRRDAWCIAYNPQYTVGVWVGNFSGEGANNLIGAEVATPLMKDIFKTLTYQQNNDWFEIPKNIKLRTICSETGLLPNIFCDNKIMDSYIPSISSIKKCEHLKEVWVDEAEKISFCHQCLPKKNAKKKLYANFSSEITSFLLEQKESFTLIPLHNPACTHLTHTREKPIILSPSPFKEYLIENENESELILSCRASPNTQKIHWYINDKFYKTTSPLVNVYFKPEIGNTKITCADDEGKKTEITIKVSKI